GIRWRGAQILPDAGDQFIFGGAIARGNTPADGIATERAAIETALAAGVSPTTALAAHTLALPAIDDALIVDLGVPLPSAAFALGFAGDQGLLQLELSALEASGDGEVIAQPKVITQDKQAARIESGVQIPYQSQAGGTAGGTTTEFIT